MQRLFSCAIIPGENRHRKQLKVELKEYFAGEGVKFTVPLKFPGSEFQQKVWRELLRIPYGQTALYGDISRCIGSVAAQRAVGRANGLNRIAIVIPCHRAVNKNGKPGGYGGGLLRKQKSVLPEKGNELD